MWVTGLIFIVYLYTLDNQVSLNLWNLNSHLIAEVQRKPRGNLIILKVILKGVHIGLKDILLRTQYPLL